MPMGNSPRPGERRHSPRFPCAGRVRIALLPIEGIYRPARLHDLSLGGCCVETTDPLEYGTRAELVIQANSSAFRALSQVKAIRTSAAGMEFLQLTASGREILRELLAQLAMIKAAHEDRSRREEAELMLPEEHSPVLIVAERLPTLGGASAAKPADGSVVVTDRQRSLLELPCEDISVDVFV